MATTRFTLEKVPQPGAWVHWFEKGRNGTPVPAQVRACSPSGRADLRLWRYEAVLPELRGGVCNQGDPWLLERPTHAHDNGVWQFMSGPPTPPKDAEEPAPAEQETEQEGVPQLSAEEAEENVLRLREKYGLGASTDIARAMTALDGVPWKYQQVNAILRKHNKLR